MGPVGDGLPCLFRGANRSGESGDGEATSRTIASTLGAILSRRIPNTGRGEDAEA